MCGRYYVDDDTAREIEKLIRQMDEKMRKAGNIHLQAGDIYPSEVALVIADDLTESFLQKTPALLMRRADSEQMSLFPAGNSK